MEFDCNSISEQYVYLYFSHFQGEFIPNDIRRIYTQWHQEKLYAMTPESTGGYLMKYSTNFPLEIIVRILSKYRYLFCDKTWDSKYAWLVSQYYLSHSNIYRNVFTSWSIVSVSYVWITTTWKMIISDKI